MKINELKINIYFMLFNKIKLIKIKIKKEQIEKIDFNKILDVFKGKSIKQDRNIIEKNLEPLQVKFEKIKINAIIGFANFMYLAYFVAILNILFSIIFAKTSGGYKKENYKYIIKPKQTQKFYLKISINCIISMKIANIINIIIKNRSEVKNERTPNRSFNGNCYE